MPIAKTNPLYSPAKIRDKKLDLTFPDKAAGTMDNTSQYADADPRLLPNVIKSPRTRVIIECPYSSEDPTLKDRHRMYAIKCLEHSLQLGEAPMLNQIFYAPSLSHNTPLNRDMGLITHLNWIMVCELVVVYTDYGISPGMQTAINVATTRAKKVEYRTIGKRV